MDAELILLADALWKELGFENVRLELNSLGQPDERKLHRAALIAHLEQHAELLDDDARRRLNSNPLRILDSKNPAMQSVVASAPKLLDFLGGASLAHFDAVKTILQVNGVAYTVNPRLVRGMDYYKLTVFEFITTSLGAQGTICAGGRYDDLMTQMGGNPAPAVGWALGVERVLELIKEQGLIIAQPALDAYAIIPEAASLPVAMKALQELRAAGVSVQMHAAAVEGMGSMKSQFKRADGSGAQYALIFGPDELAENTVAVKPLRDGGGGQVKQSLTSISAWASTLQSRT